MIEAPPEAEELCMKISKSAAVFLSAAAAFLVSAGCSPQSQSQITPTNAAAGSLRIPGFMGAGSLQRHGKNSRSWMNAKAIPDNLLYVANSNAGTVDIYSWRLLNQVGQIGDLTRPYTLCVDAQQNVYVADIGSLQVIEYAHGSTTPSKTLSDVFGYPIGCSVDPTTGNLAVSDVFGGSFGDGNVLVFPGGSGTPTEYTAPNITEYWLVGYDSSGNLFLDGDNGSGTPVALAELPAGSSSFEAITMNVTLGSPGGVQWDGTNLDVGDQSTNTIYQFTVSGTNATEVGSVVLSSASDVFQFFVPKFGPGVVRKEGNRVAVVDSGLGHADKYLYPQGGAPTQTIVGFNGPEGVTVSKGKK
jgi:hypothetical protein